MRIQLDAPAPAVLAEAGDSRRVAGVLVPYGQPGRTSMGTLTIRPGALTVPEPVSRVKLLYGHDRDHPIGAAAELADTPDALTGTFTVARTPLGDTYLAELDPDAPVRDGWSIELDDVTVEAGHVTAGTVLAVAAIPIPAYSTARAQLAAEQEPDPMPDTDTTPPDTRPAPLEAALTPTAPARTRPVSAVAELATRLSAAKMSGAGDFRAALADITPGGNGVGHEDAGLVVQAMGELWDDNGYVPQYLPLTTDQALTGAALRGWKWSPAPAVAPYDGDKAAVPSNAAKLALVEKAPSRYAGAHDIDRIYRDLGEPAVMASYWREMARSLAEQLDAAAFDIIETEAGATAAATSAWGALVTGSIAVNPYGPASYAIVAPDLAESMGTTAAADVPVGNPFPTPSRLVIGPDTMTASTVIVGIKQAVKFYTFRPPVRVEAVNVPNGGIDAGLFSYGGGFAQRPLAVCVVTVTPPV